MGSSLGCCDNRAATLSLRVMRERLQGERRRMSERPEVWVTIEQVTFKDSDDSYRPCKFCFEGVRMHATMEITGSNQQIVREIGAEAALKLLDKVRVAASSKKAGELTGNTGSSPKAVSSTSLIEVKEKKELGLDRVALGKGSSWEAKETKVFDLHALLSMSGGTGHDDVAVDVKQLEAEVSADDGSAKRVPLQSSELRKFVGSACSKRAWEVMTEQVKEALDKTGVRDP